MKKVLMTASVPSMIGQFNMNNIQILQELGFEVHVACNWKDTSVWNIDKINELKEILTKISVKIYQVSFSRHPLNLYEHIHSYNQLLEIVNKHQYKFIHCHTPIAGAISRIVCKKSNTRCIYTAHGFHFFKGAPLKNWIIFYPIEKWLSRYTNILITINKEDYKRAEAKFKTKHLEFVPGVGINIQKIKNIKVNKEKLKLELNIPKNNKIVISVGELSRRKNHQLVIKSLSNIENISYIICGQGALESYLNRLAKDNNVDLKLLGYRQDVIELMKSSDLFLFPSLQEGLPVALMEAMACGLPCIVSNIRGNNDLIIEGHNGYLTGISVSNFHENILKIMKETAQLERIKNVNKDIIKNYDIKKISNKMRKIYQECL